ncbi:hypothetical protein BDF22DRAFT_695320 [Syncephalis plumigaleata]|nr:hypothetical protein BDF22DRAFT_695320 [Syncephalis plumigaleata]
MATGWLLDADLAAIPIPPLIQRVRSVVSHIVYTERIATASATTGANADSDNTLYGPDGQRTLLRPALRALRGELRNKALAYACLISRLNYQREAARDPASAGVLNMRADLCEWLAKVAVDAHRRSLTDLVDVLTFDFSPRQGVRRPSTGIRHNRSRSRPISSVSTSASSPISNQGFATGINAAPRQYAGHYGATEHRHSTVSWNDTLIKNVNDSNRLLQPLDNSNSNNNSNSRNTDSYHHHHHRHQPVESVAMMKPTLSAPGYLSTGNQSYQPSNLDEERYYDYTFTREQSEEGDPTNETSIEDDEGRASALEIAVLCGARRFCASPAVQRIVDRIWRGDVVFYANLIDDDSAVPGNGNYASMTRARSAINVRRSRPQGFREVFRVSRMRVPRYQHLMHICIYLIFMCVYAYVLLENSPTFTGYEAVLGILAAGYVFDELTQISKCGFSFYVQHLWNPIDTLTHLNLLVFAGLRIHVLWYAQSQWSAPTYGLLACNATLLWPRLLGVFDRYRWAGRRVVILRRLIRRVLVAATPVPFILIGFTHAFYALSNGRAAPYEIIWMLLRAATGSPEIGFTQATVYHPQIGPWLMLIYLMISVGSCLSVLLAVSVHAYAESSPWSDIEYRFRYTVRVLEHVKSEALFPFVPPFNLLHIPLFFIELVLSPRYFVQLNRLLLRVLFCPILIIIYIYERVWRRRWTAFGGSIYGGGVGGSGYDDWIVMTDETAGRLPPGADINQTVNGYATHDLNGDGMHEQFHQLTSQMQSLQKYCQQLEHKMDGLIGQLEGRNRQ